MLMGALVVGGLSVVNTMLMSVTERYREIGLKKAVGAHTYHVLREYLADGKCDIGAQLHPWVTPPFDSETEAAI